MFDLENVPSPEILSGDGFVQYEEFEQNKIYKVNIVESEKFLYIKDRNI